MVFNSNNLIVVPTALIDSTQLFWAASITKLVALFLGAFIVYLAYKGYRRNASRPLLYVSIGFGLITAGTFVEGVMFVILRSDILASIASGTIVIVLGFVAIIYSIYSAK